MGKQDAAEEEAEQDCSLAREPCELTGPRTWQGLQWGRWGGDACGPHRKRGLWLLGVLRNTHVARYSL